MNDSIRRAVTGAAESCGWAVDSAAPVEVGASNAVFRIELRDGVRLAARAALQRLERYRMEELVMDEVREVGVPVPTVHAVVQVGDVSVMLTEWITGSRLADDQPTRSSRIADHCGELLAAIHSLDREGYGNLTAEGHGRRATLDEWFLDDLQPLIRAGGAVADHQGRSALERIASVLELPRPLLRAVPSRLTHGDFSPMNLLVKDGQVVGVLDWEAAKAGTVAFDFGWWDWFSGRYGTPFPTDDLLRAYARIVPIDTEELAELRRLVHMRILVGHLAWATTKNDQPAIRQALAAVTATKLA